MRTIRVFVSSPGDVEKERKLADNLIRSIVAELGIPVSVGYSNLLRSDEKAQQPLEGNDGTLIHCPYFWEYQRFSADQDYQEQMPNTVEFGLVMCVPWSRLGTPSGRYDGRRFVAKSRRRSARTDPRAQSDIDFQ